jgi:hypothetical protein
MAIIVPIAVFAFVVVLTTILGTAGINIVSERNK